MTIYEMVEAIRSGVLTSREVVGTHGLKQADEPSPCLQNAETL